MLTNAMLTVAHRLRTVGKVREAIEDYAAGTDSVRLASDQRFADWLHLQLSGFDPNHDAHLGVEPPTVTWNLSTVDLNG